MLKEMFDGKIIPSERRNPNAAKQLEISRKITAMENGLAEKLPPEDCERLKELSALYSELYKFEESDTFAYGFSVGLFLMQDALNILKTMLPDDNAG